MDQKDVLTPEQQAIRKMSLEEKEAFIESSSSEYLTAYAKLATIPSYINARQKDKIKPYLDDVLAFGQNTNDHELLANCLRLYGWYYGLLYQYGNALETLEQALQHAMQLSSFRFQIPVVAAFGNVYYQMDLNDQALKYFIQEYELAQQFDEGNGLQERSTAAKHVGTVLVLLKRYDEAIEYLNEGLELALPGLPLAQYYAAEPLGEIYIEKGELDKAMEYFELCRTDAEQSKREYPQQRVRFFTAKVLFLQAKYEEALPILLQVYSYFADKALLKDQRETALLLSDIYGTQKAYDKAYTYLKEVRELETRLSDDEAKKKGYALDAQLEMERKEKEFEVRLANARLSTLTKIASDIAHEVQNPLQFVNNFSAMNLGLVDELNECLAEGDADGVKEVATDLVDNSNKINEHGKRISTIVDHLLEQTRKAQAGELEVDGDNKHDFSK